MVSTLEWVAKVDKRFHICKHSHRFSAFPARFFLNDYFWGPENISSCICLNQAILVKHCLTPLSPLQSLQAAVFQYVIGSWVALNPATTPLHTATAPLYTDLAGGGSRYRWNTPLTSLPGRLRMMLQSFPSGANKPLSWCFDSFRQGL